MRILVLGAGAIGSVLGGFLAEAGHAVTLLGRGWHLEAVRRNGLFISGLWGEHRIRTLTTATEAAEVAGEGRPDWLFVCVRANQTASALETLTSLLGPQTLVCAFQNGLGNDEALLRAVPPGRLALGRVFFGVELQPGHARVTVCGGELLVGAPDDRGPREAVAALAAALQGSGIPCRATTTIVSALWAKALYNCALNGLSTLFEAPYGKLLEHATARRLMRAIVEEAYRVAAAHHVALDPATPEAYVEALFRRLIPDTAAHRSSMLQNLHRGHVTEIEALNGAVVRLAHDAGFEAPANALITRLVHAKERFSGLLPEARATP